MTRLESTCLPPGARESAPVVVRRPESVLIVIHTEDGEFVLKNLEWTQVYPISPAYGRDRVYPPGVTHNLEHAFGLKLPYRVPVVLSPGEHLRYRWVPAAEALELVVSHTNRAVIEQLRR